MCEPVACSLLLMCGTHGDIYIYFFCFLFLLPHVWLAFGCDAGGVTVVRWDQSSYNPPRHIFVYGRTCSHVGVSRLLSFVCFLRRQLAFPPPFLSSPLLAPSIATPGLIIFLIFFSFFACGSCSQEATAVGVDPDGDAYYVAGTTFGDYFDTNEGDLEAPYLARNGRGRAIRQEETLYLVHSIEPSLYGMYPNPPSAPAEPWLKRCFFGVFFFFMNGTVCTPRSEDELINVDRAEVS